MLVKISKEIIEKYPLTELGYVVAKISVNSSDDFIENIKGRLLNVLNENNINEKNYSTHPQIEGWRNVFKDFGVSHKSNRSSVEALVKRIVSGTKMFGISNVVDLYNCCSVLSLLPMGGYDIDKVKQNIHIRYGQDNDKFEPLGTDKPVKVENKHIVYADEEKVICWLWNFRDSKHTCISETTKHAIFFLDSAFQMKHIEMKDALQLFEEGLAKLGAEVTSNGILSKQNPEVVISFEKPAKTIVDGKTGLFDKILEKKASMSIISSKPIEKKQQTKPLVLVPENVPFVPLPVEKMATTNYAIHCAATGNIQSLKDIIEYNKSLIESKDWSGNTLIMHAAVGDHENVLSFILGLNSAFNLNHKNKFGETVFDLATKHKSFKSLSILTGTSDNNTIVPQVEINSVSDLAAKHESTISLKVESVSDRNNNISANSMNQDVYNAICSLLNENHIEYRIEEHEPPYTCASEGKSILMKIDDTFHLFAYTASRRINSKLIKKHFGAKKMRFATSDELFTTVKLVPGSVPTFGEPILPLKLFIDKDMVTNNKEITLSMGSVSHYAVMKMLDYLRVSKYETFEFTEE